MEIINYVQSKPRTRRVNTFVVGKKSGTKSRSAISFNGFNTELKSFGAQRIKPKMTVKTAVMGLGRGISSIEEFLGNNIKIISISAVVLIAVVAGITTASLIHRHYENFTNQIKLPSATSSDSSDIETLNKLMADFALIGTADYDDAGNLVDSVRSSVSYSQPVSYQNYRVQKGDTISGIAKKFGLSNISTLISVNNIENVRQLAAGQKLQIPSMDGIVYTVRRGDTLDSLVKKYNVKLETLVDVNELASETLSVGANIFIPGAAMDARALKEAMGDLFTMPIKAKFRWSSPYGSRVDPIAGVKSFHTGTDMACPTGTPIYAAMSGTVSTTGINRVYGNYVIIDHGNGYQTLYAHMSKIIATKGQYVSSSTKIGLVGSTGYSTGPHLHFTVYKNGKMIDPMSILNR